MKLDVLKKLSVLQYNGIKVPCVVLGTSCANRLVPHKQHGVAGAYVENGARDELTIDVTIPFRQGIAWLYGGDLYPTLFRQFLSELLKKTVGILVHPDFGQLDVYVAKWGINWDPGKRDGCDVTVSFSETNETGMALETLPDPSFASTSIVALNEFLTTVEFEDEEGGMSLTDALNVLDSIESQIQLAGMNIANQIAKIDGAINDLNDFVDKVNGIRNPNTWAVLDALKSITNSLEVLKDNLVVKQTKKISLRTMQADKTPEVAAAMFGMEAGDFYSLNPAVANAGIAKKGSTVYVFETTT